MHQFINGKIAQIKILIKFSRGYLIQTDALINFFPRNYS